MQDAGDTTECEKDENWYGGWMGIYVAPRDPHVVVRKRAPRMGWTLNFARPVTWLLVLLILVLPAVILALVGP